MRKCLWGSPLSDPSLPLCSWSLLHFYISLSLPQSLFQCPSPSLPTALLSLWLSLFCHLQSRQLRIQIPSALLSPRTFKKWWICAPASCPYSWKNSKGRRWLNFRLLPLIWNISVSLKMIKVLLHLQHVSVLECTHKLSNMVFLYFLKQPYQLFWVLAKTLLSSIC